MTVAHIILAVWGKYSKSPLEFSFERDADASSAGLCLLAFAWSLTEQQLPWWITKGNDHLTKPFKGLTPRATIEPTFLIPVPCIICFFSLKAFQTFF